MKRQGREPIAHFKPDVGLRRVFPRIRNICFGQSAQNASRFAKGRLRRSFVQVSDQDEVTTLDRIARGTQVTNWSTSKHWCRGTELQDVSTLNVNNHPLRTAEITWIYHAEETVTAEPAPIKSVAHEGAHRSIAHASAAPDLLTQIPQDKGNGNVAAVAAYDPHKCPDAIAARNAYAVIPPRQNAKF